MVRSFISHHTRYKPRMGLTSSSTFHTYNPKGGTMFERFTDRARRTVVLAQEEARLLNHNYIGTEHLLLGLIHEGESIAWKALEAHGVTLEIARNAIEKNVGFGNQAPSSHIPYTPRCKKAMECALREAITLGHNYIGTEHLLLGLIKEATISHDRGVAAKVLNKFGCDVAVLRTTVLSILNGTHSSSTPSPADQKEVPTDEPTPTPAQQALAHVRKVTVQLKSEQATLLHNITICRNAEALVNWSLNDRADRLEGEVHKLQTKLDELSEIEEELRNLIEVQRKSEEALKESLEKIVTLLK
jgi:ATP-dependent Clp protease ATP-binding subunit ClpA